MQTVQDFWFMVWQERIEVIIMGCEVVEQGKVSLFIKVVLHMNSMKLVIPLHFIL